MKFYYLPVFLALVLSIPVVEGRLFGILHGDSDEEGVANENDGPGWFLSDNELKAGRRGLACLQYAANVENDPFNSLSVMLGPMTRVLLSIFGEDTLNMICASTYSGRKLLAEANGEEEPIEETYNHSTPFESEERRTQTCSNTNAVYPTDGSVDPEAIYAEYANWKYKEFVTNGDLKSRSDTTIVIERLQNELSRLYDVQSGLTLCSSIWGAINDAISIADVPFVDPESLSEAIMAFSCDLANDYNDIVISRKLRDIERLVYHDQLIDSAEIHGAFQNSKTLLTTVCAVSSNLGTMQLEMEVLDASV